MFKPETLVYTLLQRGSPSYFGPSLSLSSCSHCTRHSHHDRQYLAVPPFHSSLYKSVKHFGHCFAFDAPKIWNDLPTNVCNATSITSFTKRVQNLPVCRSLSTIASRSPLSSLVWPSYVIGLTIIHMYICFCSFVH